MAEQRDGKTRINRVITRGGDKGLTGLADGSRVSKDHARIEALGEVDELSSALGVLRARGLDADLDAILDGVQQLLLDLGGELAVPGTDTLEQRDLLDIEVRAEALNAELAPLREFVLPGGHPDAAWCHHCRTLARRVERRLVRLGEQEPVNPVSLAVSNRLGDLLFMMARAINRRSNTPEPQWIRRSER